MKINNKIIFFIILIILFIIVYIINLYYNKQLKEKQNHIYHYSNVLNYNSINTAVIYRVHSLLKNQIFLINKVSNEIKGKYDCYLLTDEIDFNITINGCKKCVVTFDDITKRYPSIYNINEYYKTYYIITSKQQFFWAFNTEQYYMWYEKFGLKYSYMYFLEADVGFSGNINIFLNEYDNDKSDYLVKQYDKMTSEWPFSKCATPNYLDYLQLKLGNDVYYSSPVLLIRWSYKLMNILKEYLNKGYHRHSESSAIEACLMENLNITVIDKKFIGEYYSWYHRVDENKWIELNKNNNSQNKFYHALKF